MIRIDHPVTLEHDEKLVAVMMAVVFMPGAGLEHGPADYMIGARSFLIDQKLHLHVDPAVIALEALDLWYVAQIGAIHYWRRFTFFPFGHRAFHGFSESATDFLSG